MNQELPTSGQLERDLSQKIQKLYRQELDHSTGKVTCQLFGNKLAIVIEQAITAVEKTLAEHQSDRAVLEELNVAIGESLKSKLKELVETISAVEVVDILFDSTFKSDCTGAIIVLKETPPVRNPQSIPKNNVKKRSPNEDSLNESSS